jgi:translation initiation factor IF-3
VRLVDAEGEMLGVVSIAEALKTAEAASLDLVEVSPTAEPPVCKLMDFGKFKYELQRKVRSAKKKQKVVELKEIKLRPTIGQNDYEIKLRSVKKFLQEGNKVKISLRFRGREITHQENAFALIKKLQADVEELSKVEFAPKMDGKQLLMVLAPK